MPSFRPRPFRVAVVDFDGTVSLIREGWSRVMADVGLDVLNGRCVEGRSRTDVSDEIEEQMLRLSGRPSLVQMAKLAEMLAGYGATPPTPAVLHDEFLKRLYAQIDGRKKDLASGKVKPAAWAVPGTHDLLGELRSRGIALYLVSGTDLAAVNEESQLLSLGEFFGDRVYAPSDLTPDFHKRDAIAQILRDTGTKGEELIGFGDGFSETVEVKRVGGTAVGVASVEVGKVGPCRRKAMLLAEWGADPIVPDYADDGQLVERLFQ